VPRTSIILADDNVSVLNYVCEMLKKDYEIVGAFNSGEQVLCEWPRLRPKVILLDISMGDTDGIGLARCLRDSGCDSKIVFLTIHKDPEIVKAALEAGGAGYVLKQRMYKDLGVAIDTAISGKQFVSPTAALARD